MTHVINQGMAMYWGTSRWSSMEIMVSHTVAYLSNCVKKFNTHHIMYCIPISYNTLKIELGHLLIS